jgi:hypothetical protein
LLTAKGCLSNREGLDYALVSCGYSVVKVRAVEPLNR